MSNSNRAGRGEKALGQIGLFLMLLVARLADRGYSPHHTVAGRLGSALARRAIDAVAVVGWLADRLPEPPYATAGAVGRVHDTYRVRPA